MNHNPQLSAAVARVMGRKISISDAMGEPDGAHVPAKCYIDDCGDWRDFMPDINPSDAWEVLEWLESRDYVVLFRGYGVIIKTRDGTMRTGESGADWKDALCRAVAALGK